MRRFYDLLSTIKERKPYYTIRISQEVKQDALVWLEFLANFNGECYLPEDLWLCSDTIELFTDSAGHSSLGCGAYFAGHWCQFKWPAIWDGSDLMRDITLLELVPILLALYCWASCFVGKNSF